MRHPRAGLLVALAAAAAAAACGSSTQKAAQPAVTVTVTPSTTQAPTSTVTSTQTQAPAPAPSTTQTQSQPVPTPIPAPAPPTLSPAQVVEEYYAAINAHDYATAWNLGGFNFSPSYSAFVNGFAGTAADEVTVTGSQGDVVSIRLAAVQDDGSVKFYQGTYTAHGGRLTGANIQQTG